MYTHVCIFRSGSPKLSECFILKLSERKSGAGTVHQSLTGWDMEPPARWYEKPSILMDRGSRARVL